MKVKPFLRRTLRSPQLPDRVPTLFGINERLQLLVLHQPVQFLINFYYVGRFNKNKW